MANPNDYFLGENVLSEIMERLRMYKADLLIGKHVVTRNIENCGLFNVNFLQARNVESNLYSYVKVFKKYLFDSLSMYDLKKEKETGIMSNNFQRLSEKYEWFDDDDEYTALFSLIVELSENPIRFDYINYVIDSRDIHKEKIQSSIHIIKNKQPRNHKNIVRGRKNFIPNINKIEIDITYDCNLKCLGCNRSCTQAPSKGDYMEIEQIKRFIKESVELGHKWELINILGGEPTLHPQFIEIVELMLEEYIWKHSPETILQITSNGYTDHTRKLLDKVSQYKNVVVDKLSFKNDRNVIYFTSFNIAPIDLKEFKNAEFHKGCWVTSYCGIGLNKYGDYAYSIAGGIDRVIGFDLGIKALKDVRSEKLKKHLDIFCRYCGNFVEYDINRGDFIPRCERDRFKNKITKFWIRIYKNYNKRKPKLTHY
ncbi:MAG: radical SAM protein [Desulfurobacteriaceae bacterium]